MTEQQTVDTGREYLPGAPVRVVVKHRGIRYDLDDAGAAVRIAGRPKGWHERVERIVAEEGLNVARDGRVFVTVVEGRDIAALTAKVADTSLRVCDALLDLED